MFKVIFYQSKVIYLDGCRLKLVKIANKCPNIIWIVEVEHFGKLQIILRDSTGGTQGPYIVDGYFCAVII